MLPLRRREECRERPEGALADGAKSSETSSGSPVSGRLLLGSVGDEVEAIELLGGIKYSSSSSGRVGVSEDLRSDRFPKRLSLTVERVLE